MKQHATRRRGVLLTSRGLQRLQVAISALEMAQNNGNNFTLEQLSERIQISTKTLSRLWSLNAGVDQKTLKICFSAFDLELCSEDYTISSESDVAETRVALSSSDTKEISSLQSKASGCLQEKSDTLEYICSYPDGPVAPDSALYIERPPLENLAEQEITQPGCVIRIRAPRDMGKTSLVLRLTAFAQQQGYYTVKLDFRQIDRLCLSDLNHFFYYLCWRIAKELNIEPNLDDNWDEEVGSKLSCFFYLKNYLLPQINSPLVLVLEQVDHLFEYPQIAQEFWLFSTCYAKLIIKMPIQ
jgi:transcriptional regulator with XRE-family HTH domain